MPEDRWASPTPRRPRSTREVLRPNVHDISEQAACYAYAEAYHQEDAILSVLSSCSPRQSRSGSDGYCDKFGCPAPLLSIYNAEEVIKSSPTGAYSQRNHEFPEDMHRQRVLVSAQQRHRLHKTRRSKSVMDSRSVSSRESPESRETIQVDPAHRLERDSTCLSLVATNSNNETIKNRPHYKLPHRLRAKTTPTKLMMSGSPLPILNGYHQQLIHAHPKYSENYCRWLTNSLKIQTFSVSTSRPPSRSAPVLRYMNRPKTSSTDRWSSTVAVGTVDMNVTGLQPQLRRSVTHDVSTAVKQTGSN